MAGERVSVRLVSRTSQQAHGRTVDIIPRIDRLGATWHEHLFLVLRQCDDARQFNTCTGPQQSRACRQPISNDNTNFSHLLPGARLSQRTTGLSRRR